jgi:hypothetical protein
VALVSHERADVSAAEQQMLRDFAISRIVDQARLRKIGVFRRLCNRVASLLMVAANVLLPRRPVALPPSRAAS